MSNDTQTEEILSRSTPSTPLAEMAGEPAHPLELTLQQYANNEMSARRRKRVAAHLEQCSECRAAIQHIHALNRRFRDFTRLALSRLTYP